MIKIKKALVLLSAVTVISLMLTSESFARSFRSPSFGGATGLIATPTAYTGWTNANIGVDASYHYIADGDGYHIPKVNVQFLNVVEAGFAYDVQPNDDNNDFLIHAKFNFLKRNSSALAVGGNVQLLKVNDQSFQDFQLYLAATYSGSFFSMPAETTLVFGKTFGDDRNDSNIDFSMGFDLLLFPALFKGYAHWINDFSNYSYSMNAGGANSGLRGCFNTGIRLSVLKDSRFKLNFDIIMTDALDTNRNFAIGLGGGMSF